MKKRSTSIQKLRNKKYRTYIEKKKQEYFEVFILHGTNEEWREVFKIVERLKFKARELSLDYNSVSINEKVRDAIYWNCNFAIANFNS